MFYSHQLLARKAPLGQIWMAATLHAKMNRRKLDKLNIIKICEEILNPTVPMALRLSGILMGGVVIVYDRKVKLLYDDANRFLLELNEAWKMKTTPSSDPTILSKSKLQAKYKSVTLPEVDLGDLTAAMDQSLNLCNTNSAINLNAFQHQPGEYFTMRLDCVDESNLVNNEIPRDDHQNHHQADPANITLVDTFDSFQQPGLSLYDRFERFDIEGDEDTHMNFPTTQEQPKGPTLPSSPPLQEQVPSQEFPPQQGNDEIQDMHIPEPQVHQQSDERETVGQAKQGGKIPRESKRKGRPRTCYVHMDLEQTIIPGNIYQSWIQDPTDLLSGRGSQNQVSRTKPAMDIAHLMELPPCALHSGFSGVGTEVYYPKPFIDLYMRSAQQQTPPAAPSRRNLPRQTPAPTDVENSSPPTPPAYNQGQGEFPVEDFHSGVGSHPMEASIEKQMENMNISEIPFNDLNVTITPRNSAGVASAGSNERTVPSSASGNGLVQPEQLSERSSRKRPYSSSKLTGSNGLDPVAEEYPVELSEPTLKLQRLSESGPFYDQEILMETGPTQTPLPIFDQQPIDAMTEVVRTHLKTHFETPGTSEIESLNQLANGMNTKRAALLFYQTCVLATRNFLKVRQDHPYGDILISRGPKM